MTEGIGIDICEISRMEKLKDPERFAARFFSDEEREYINGKGVGRAQTMAGLFAAKEALGKAAGGGLDFELREACVAHDEAGRPFFRFTGKAAERFGGKNVLLSITHDGGYAAAVCIMEEKQ